MATPAEIVASSFAQAQTYANNAQTALTGFTTALDAAIYAPPTLSVTWNSIAAPSLPSLPSVPTLPTIAFVAPSEPSALSLAAPTLTIDDFTVVAPTTTFPTAPTLSYGTVPTVPAVASITVPDAPVLTMPSVPSYLALSTPTFGGFDPHQSYLDKLDAIPTLSLVAPTPYSYSLGAQYASTLLTTLKARLLERMTGGSGLVPAVEQALWDRARSRETTTAQASQDEVMRTSEAFGFHLPTGVLAAQLREAQQGYFDKLSSLSRDVAIKQAELEQENMKQTISQGMELEGRLIDYSYKLEQLAFDAAKAMADNALQIHNALVDKFKALLSAYQTYASAYDTVIKAELAKVEVFKALLAGEETKASINRNLVEQYKATIDSGLSVVKIFEAQISAANSLMQLEGVKISAVGEQIKAYVAQANIETSKLEAYKVGVQAESEKLGAYKIKADVFRTVTDAQAERARLELGRYTALNQSKSAEWESYRARVGAEGERIRALGLQSIALLDGYKAGATALQTEAGMHTKIWETEIKNYESGQQIALQAGKINADSLIATNNARLDASKVGAQVYAQLTSSAYGMIHASAGVSASSGTTASNAVSYSYSNDTTGTVTPVAYPISI